MRPCVLSDSVCAQRVRDSYECGASERQHLACAIKRIEEDNAVCLCGCPPEEHESQGEDGEQCAHEDHDCIRVCRAARNAFVAMRDRAGDAAADA